MNIPSSPRFYAIVSKGDPDTSATTTTPRPPSLSRTSTPAMFDPAPETHYTQLSPILSNAGDPSRWRAEALPARRSVGQTPSPENNHWLNVRDRFVYLGGDNGEWWAPKSLSTNHMLIYLVISENFRAYIVEATHRAALVPFEAKATHHSPGASSPTEHWFPYVEPARVFVNPGKPWFKVIDGYKSMSQAREMGVPKRKWVFVDGRDQATRDCPGELGTRRAVEFVQAALEIIPGDSGEWNIMWELMVGTAESLGVRSGWSWKDDLRYGFIWPPDVGVPLTPIRARSH